MDLGATFLPTAFGPSGNPISGTVTIPTTFPTFDLGVIPISGSLELDYSFTFDAFTSGGFESLLEGEFSDPFHLSTNPALGTTTFEPVGAPVPEPSTLALIGSGGLALLACARRRRARRPCVIRWLIGDFASNDSSMNKLTLTGNVP